MLDRGRERVLSMSCHGNRHIQGLCLQMQDEGMLMVLPAFVLCPAQLNCTRAHQELRIASSDATLLRSLRPPLFSFPNFSTSLHPFVCRDQPPLEEEGAGEDKKTDRSDDGSNHRAPFRLTITGNLGRGQRLIAQVCFTQAGKTHKHRHTHTGEV